MASYISTFNEHVVQVEWNEASLIAQFQGGLKDEILDFVATIGTQSHRLYESMAMASQIDKRLLSRRQNQHLHMDSLRSKSTIVPPQDLIRRFQASLRLVPMEFGMIQGTQALAKIAIEWLKYQCH